MRAFGGGNVGLRLPDMMAMVSRNRSTPANERACRGVRGAKPVGLILISTLLLATPFLIVLKAWAPQAPEDNRPPLFFREDWKEIAAAAPVTQDHIANPKLQVVLYGPGKDGVRKSHHDTPKDDPYYIWLGSCPANCAIGLRDKDAFVDLTGLAKIRWRTKQTGFRNLRLTLKLADGTWLVSDYAEGPSVDWHESEFSIAGIRWRRMDIKTIVEGPCSR